MLCFIIKTTKNKQNKKTFKYIPVKYFHKKHNLHISCLTWKTLTSSYNWYQFNQQCKLYHDHFVESNVNKISSGLNELTSDIYVKALNFTLIKLSCIGQFWYLNKRKLLRLFIFFLFQNNNNHTIIYYICNLM